jgi:hypothetical protein
MRFAAGADRRAMRGSNAAMQAKVNPSPSGQYE